MNNGHTSLDPSANVDPRTRLQSGWGAQAGSAAALICDTGEMLDYLEQTADELLEELRVRPSLGENSDVLDSIGATESLMGQLMERKDTVFVALAAVDIHRINEQLESVVIRGCWSLKVRAPRS